MKPLFISILLLIGLVVHAGPSSGNYFGGTISITAAGGGGGGGGSMATDNFTRATASPISSPMSDGISTWTSPVSTSFGWYINSINQALGLGSGANMMMVNTPSFTANQTNTITIGTSAVGYGVMARMNGSGQGYIAYTDSTTTLDIYKSIGLTGTTLNSPTSLGTHTIATIIAGAQLTITAVGTTLSAYTNGVFVFSVTDSTYATGQPGAYTSNTSSPITGFTAQSP